MKRLVFTSLLAAGFASAAGASVPTPRDVAAAEALFGYDKIVAVAVARGRSSLDSKLATLAPETRSCVQKVIADAFTRKVDGIFAELFESSENISAWIEFSHSPTGAKFIAFLQRGAAAIVSGQAAPADANFNAALSDAEKDQLKAFLATPAGAVLAKGFPSLPKGLSDAELRQLEQISITTCAYHLDGTP